MRLQRRSRGVNGLYYQQRTITQGGEAPLRAWEQQGPETDQTTCATLSWLLDDLLSVLPWLWNGEDPRAASHPLSPNCDTIDCQPASRFM